MNRILMSVLLASVSAGAAFAAPAPYGAVVTAMVPPPNQMTPRQQASVSVTMENSGSNSWAASEGYELGSQGPKDNTYWTTGRIHLAAGDSVATNGSKTFTFTIQAPSQPGAYTFQWRMAQDKKQWFGQRTPAITVTVAGTPSQSPNVVTAPSSSCQTNWTTDCGDNPAAVLGSGGNWANGYQFVGWSPQDHPNGGAGNPKYDAYNYLITHHVNPNDTNWAAQAASDLNRQYPGLFSAYDGQTLHYGNEYIHTADPGHGDPGGAIPGARGEFIWIALDS